MGLEILDGRKFGRLTVAGAVSKGERGISYLCRCECGELAVVLSTRLRSGNTRSCGCLQEEMWEERLGRVLSKLEKTRKENGVKRANAQQELINMNIGKGR